MAGLKKSLFVKRFFCFIAANLYTRQSKISKSQYLLILILTCGIKTEGITYFLTCKFLWSVRKSFDHFDFENCSSRRICFGSDTSHEGKVVAFSSPAVLRSSLYDKSTSNRCCSCAKAYSKKLLFSSLQSP
jgi:hypothetical protein